MKIKVHYLFISLALLAGIYQTTAQTTNFILSSTVDAAGSAGQFVLMDVDGNGKLDIITSTYAASGTVKVLTNNGSGNFGLNATYNVGGYPLWVMAMDVNGDDKQDLITANSGDNTLTVLTNNGSGVFGSNATVNTSFDPTCVAAVDINGDGKLALAVANQGNFSGSTLTIFTNNGSGVFGLNNTLGVGTGPCFVMATDVNGDGKADLICANHYSHSLTVMTNNGQGGFSISCSPTTGNEPLSAAAADINSDGKIDLISTDFGGGSGGGNTLTVSTNAGNGVFGLYATLNVGNQPNALAAADVSGDGRPDLICANNFSGNVSVLLNNGDGTFTRTDYATAFNCIFVAVTDWNGDGKPDLLTANGSSGTFTLLTNNITFPPPLLQIAPCANQSVLFWKASATNFILQSTTNVDSTNWEAATDAVQVIAFTISNTTPKKFFRLQSR